MSLFTQIITSSSFISLTTDYTANKERKLEPLTIKFTDVPIFVHKDPYNLLKGADTPISSRLCTMMQTNFSGDSFYSHRQFKYLLFRFFNRIVFFFLLSISKFQMLLATYFQNVI